MRGRRTGGRCASWSMPRSGARARCRRPAARRWWRSPTTTRRWRRASTARPTHRRRSPLPTSRAPRRVSRRRGWSRRWPPPGIGAAQRWRRWLVARRSTLRVNTLKAKPRRNAGRHLPDGGNQRRSRPTACGSQPAPRSRRIPPFRTVWSRCRTRAASWSAWRSPPSRASGSSTCAPVPAARR